MTQPGRRNQMPRRRQFAKQPSTRPWTKCTFSNHLTLAMKSLGLYEGCPFLADLGCLWRRPGQHFSLLSFNPAIQLHFTPSELLRRDLTGWWPLAFDIFLWLIFSSSGIATEGLKILIMFNLRLHICNKQITSSQLQLPHVTRKSKLNN